MGRGWKRILIKLNLISVKKTDSLPGENGNCHGESNKDIFIEEDNSNNDADSDKDTTKDNDINLTMTQSNDLIEIFIFTAGGFKIEMLTYLLFYNTMELKYWIHNVLRNIVSIYPFIFSL